MASLADLNAHLAAAISGACDLRLITLDTAGEDMVRLHLAPLPKEIAATGADRTYEETVRLMRVMFPRAREKDDGETNSFTVPRESFIHQCEKMAAYHQATSDSERMIEAHYADIRTMLAEALTTLEMVADTGTGKILTKEQAAAAEKTRPVEPKDFVVNMGAELEFTAFIDGEKTASADEVAEKNAAIPQGAVKRRLQHLLEAGHEMNEEGLDRYLPEHLQVEALSGKFAAGLEQKLAGSFHHTNTKITFEPLVGTSLTTISAPAMDAYGVDAVRPLYFSYPLEAVLHFSNPLAVSRLIRGVRQKIVNEATALDPDTGEALYPGLAGLTFQTKPNTGAPPCSIHLNDSIFSTGGQNMMEQEFFQPGSNLPEKPEPVSELTLCIELARIEFLQQGGLFFFSRSANDVLRYGDREEDGPTIIGTARKREAGCYPSSLLPGPHRDTSRTQYGGKGGATRSENRVIGAGAAGDGDVAANPSQEPFAAELVEAETWVLRRGVEMFAERVKARAAGQAVTPLTEELLMEMPYHTEARDDSITLPNGRFLKPEFRLPTTWDEIRDRFRDSGLMKQVFGEVRMEGMLERSTELNKIHAANFRLGPKPPAHAPESLAR
ncbi:MAG: hypothetical protein IT567_05055 [Alphaproteobacteria bacterium]|nr:hypothetical protein [Alphaproteobacteria bacterium]